MSTETHSLRLSIALMVMSSIGFIFAMIQAIDCRFYPTIAALMMCSLGVIFQASSVYMGVEGHEVFEDRNISESTFLFVISFIGIAIGTFGALIYQSELPYSTGKKLLVTTLCVCK